MLLSISFSSRIRYLVSWALLDSLTLLVAFAVAFFVRTIVTPQDFAQVLDFLLLVIVITLVTFYAWGIYHRMWRRTSGHEVSIIVYAVAIDTILICLIDLMVSDARPLPLSVVILGYALASAGFVVTRFRSRLVSGLSWRWKAVWKLEFPNTDKSHETRILIVGAGEAGQNIAWRFKRRWNSNEERFDIVGFVDDDPDKQGLYLESTRILGTSADIPHIASEHNVDLIVIAIHNITGPEFRKILERCERTHARIRVLPDAFAILKSAESTPVLRDVKPEDLLGRKTIGRHDDVDFTPVTGKRVLITGAAGSIGSELSRQMLSYEPAKLVLLDNNESGLHDLIIELSAKQPTATLVPLLADVTNEMMVSEALKHHQPQVVFHTAAYKHVPMMELYPYEAVQVNVRGTKVVAELSREFGVERFVLISTDKAVDPTSVMGASKRVCELMMHALAQQSNQKTLFTSVRFGNVLGSRGSVVPMFAQQIKAGGPVTVTDPEMTRYFMTIPEAVNLVIHAACLTTGDDLFMLRMGEVVKIVELAERMIRLQGLRPYDDIAIKFTGMRPGEKLHEELMTGSETVLPTVHPHIVNLVSESATVDFGTLMQGVNRMLKECQPIAGNFIRDARVSTNGSGATYIPAQHHCINCLTSFMNNQADAPTACLNTTPDRP